MAASQQELLRKAWLGGRDGYLSALSEARAWALREVWREEGKPAYGMCVAIADKVVKVGGGAPTKEAVRQLFEKVDADAGWFPGKSNQTQHGPASAITPTNQSVAARSAMSMKERGQEPTYADLVAACPNALLNPDTGNPVGKKRVYAIMRGQCFDDPDDPEDKWKNQRRLSKTALTDSSITLRLAWGKLEQAKRHQAIWFYMNLVWSNLCNTILPRTEKRHWEMTLARKGTRGWISSKTKLESRNLRGKKEALKQKSWDSIRVWWAPVLSRGKLHIELLPENFPGETPAGAAILAAKIRSALNVRFQGSDAPDVLFVDRGQGFYRTRGAKITPEFKDALAENNLKAYYGENASVQPGNMQDVLLHETAVSWIRARETRTRPEQPWKESPKDFGVRLRAICHDINKNCDVEGLCRQLPERLQEVVDRQGDRLGK